MIKYRMVCIDTKPLPLTNGKIYEVSSQYWNQDGENISTSFNPSDPGEVYKYHHGIIDSIDVVCDDGVSRSVSYMRFIPMSEIRNEKLEQLLKT
jgi:hypothetical protein